MKKVLIASGASGGHLFPAIAVADALRESGDFDVTMVLGGSKFSDVVANAGLPYRRLPAAAFNDRGPVRLVLAVLKLMWGVGYAFRMMVRERPALVFGTGGYATVALMVAAKVLRVPTMIHEQNVLPGRANRLLARFADVVLLTFEESKKYLPPVRGRVVVTGTPLRKQILDAAAKGVAKGKEFTIFVTGGSQGARILNEVVPETLAMMESGERKGVHVIHQARPDDVERVRSVYESLGLAGCEVQSFFRDMPAQYAAADLLIGRSGVSTILESAIFGVPAIYVPLNLADGHQKYNAAVAEQAGAAVVVGQAYFTPANLLVHIMALKHDRARLEAMARAAVGLAVPDATERVVQVIRESVM